METVSVREARERISWVLDRIEAGEEILILRRGKPAARVSKPKEESVRFRSRAALRGEIPPMRESASTTVRTLRDEERF